MFGIIDSVSFWFGMLFQGKVLIYLGIISAVCYHVWNEQRIFSWSSVLSDYRLHIGLVALITVFGGTHIYFSGSAKWLDARVIEYRQCTSVGCQDRLKKRIINRGYDWAKVNTVSARNDTF